MDPLFLKNDNSVLLVCACHASTWEAAAKAEMKTSLGYRASKNKQTPHTHTHRKKEQKWEQERAGSVILGTCCGIMRPGVWISASSKKAGTQNTHVTLAPRVAKDSGLWGWLASSLAEKI